MPRLHMSMSVPGIHGKRPEDRTIAELLQAGVVNVDKPQGPTSHQVTAWVRDIFKVEKSGHLGTLDPRVTGVLPVALNNAVRALDALLLDDKEYVCVMHVHRPVPEAQIRETCAAFTGKIFQFPPVRSAVKRQRRVREIYSLDVLEVDDRSVLFVVRCESGTYIRTLCHDIGEALGTGASMGDLRRSKSAGFLETDAHPLQEVRDAWLAWKEGGDESKLRKILLPMEALFSHLHKIAVKDSAVDAICHGASLATPGIASLDAGVAKGSVVAVMTQKGEVVALGESLMDGDTMAASEDGIAVRITRVLMSPETYPRMWSRGHKGD
ncbi:MAG: RNA-guided pseudouridylation complex pseudouridine synthase subunit Cbf5 [Methanobacteriota archaeon]